MSIMVLQSSLLQRCAQETWFLKTVFEKETCGNELVVFNLFEDPKTLGLLGSGAAALIGSSGQTSDQTRHATDQCCDR